MLKAKVRFAHKRSQKPVTKRQHVDIKKSKSIDISRNYNQYFTSGAYKQRYPKANRCSIQFICRYINKIGNSNILDYGCGSGRYLMNLLERYTEHNFTAYDISVAPLNILRKTLQQTNQQKQVDIVNDLNTLYEKFSKPNSQIGIALLLFGVLSHIASTERRQSVLSFIRDSLDSKGYLILSVPNCKRRFLKLQKQQGSHEINYQRIINQQTVNFYYHLYSESTIKKELEMSGFSIEKIQAESLLPEYWVTNFPVLGWIDQQLCRWIPASWGYGMLISCKPNQ